MLTKPLDSIVEADIRELVTNRVSEVSVLEYKQQLPGAADRDGREFLADVSSLANTFGGDLIFGVAERRQDGKPTGEPERIAGLGAAFNAGAEIAAMESRLRDGLAPPLLVAFREVSTSSGAVLVLRVPRSWNAPHMVKSTSRFYARATTGKYPMDVYQLRSAFEESSGAAERVQQRRLERTSMLLDGRSPTAISAKGPSIVLHAVPLSAGSLRATAAPLPALSIARGAGLFDGHGLGVTPNFDGALVYDGGVVGRVVAEYTQVFRDGSVEWVNKTLPYEDVVPGGVLADRIVQCASRVLNLGRTYPQLLPYALMLSILDVRGHRLAVGVRPGLPFDRDHLLFIAQLVDGQEAAPAAVRPLLDALWQSAGWPQCTVYDDDGNWAPMR
jgi:hypothetical protein